MSIKYDQQVYEFICQSSLYCIWFETYRAFTIKISV